MVSHLLYNITDTLDSFTLLIYAKLWRPVSKFYLFVHHSFSFTFPPGIVEYMGEQSGPPSKQVQAVKQVQEHVKDGDDAVIVGVFSSEQDAAYEIYIEACKYQRAGDLCNKRVILNE